MSGSASSRFWGGGDSALGIQGQNKDVLMLTSEFICALGYNGDISSQFVLLHMQVGIRFKIVVLLTILFILWDITFPKVLL